MENEKEISNEQILRLLNGIYKDIDALGGNLLILQDYLIKHIQDTNAHKGYAYQPLELTKKDLNH